MRHMAANHYSNYDALGTDGVDAIEGLNEKLLELLKNPAPKHIDFQRSRSLSGTNSSDNDADSQLDTNYAEQSAALLHYKYEYAFLHHNGSPVSKTLPNYLLPIGVFWDIENCPVPRGRSATAVVQVIRDKFFHGYKEAEFIVVCDIHKENKQVIQELNDAQVNLIHVPATYKNAADEKLKQSIRRFADIHGSPAAIILISSDINFAADLSDLRHRKKIHVILLHNENSSEALILCANEHFNFMELMEPLPARTPAKALEFHDLLIGNLPKDKGSVWIKRRLKRLSDNCGGRVIGINANTAIIRFSSQDSADRAQKRMDGEPVSDAKITVKFLKEKDNRRAKESSSTLDLASESGTATGSPVQMYNSNSTIGGVRSLPGTPHYNSSSPVVGAFTGWNGMHGTSMNPHAPMMPPGPVFAGRPYANNGDIPYNRSVAECSRGQSPIFWPGGVPYGRSWEESKIDRSKGFAKRNQVPQVRDNSLNNGQTPEGMRRIRGAHSGPSHSIDWNGPRPHYNMQGNGSNYAPNSFKRRTPSPLLGNQGRDIINWNNQGKHMQTHVRSIRTPSPYSSVMHMNQVHRTSPYQRSESENEEIEHFFNPIRNSTNANGSHTPIELQVTNLDQNMEPKEMKRVLAGIFMEHVMVLHISVFMQSDGNFAASVKVPSLQDAQYAISQLHRRKVGYKRILISYAHTGGPNPQLVRSQIVMLLQEVPGYKLPLFKFREMYESRFLISISVSELYKMKDVCFVTEDPSGRMVSLNPDHRNTPSPCLGNLSQDGTIDLPYCTIHTQKPWSDKGWAEQEMASLPNVMIPLKTLAGRVHQLLTSHNGSLPLPSLPNCYQAEFNQAMDVHENGVPLEHLVSCLPSVELTQGVGSVKFLVWVGTHGHDENHDEKCVSPPLANQLALFSRELVDLLKTAPHCQIQFNRFIPAYHHHFGRQCRVADYGFTKLIDLLEALSHTVQVMGEGNKRVVTLSHRAQVRRFTSDLLRVLKAQASKQITLSEFPSVYARVIAKPWDIVDYGVCDINDILSEVSENTVVVTKFNDVDKLIAIPKREQTPEEIERTKQFAVEVIELLKHAPQCSMLFNKFVPSYHHHFGHQCRVSDYGFTKLIELFEAIPHVVKIDDDSGGERRISLTEKEGLHVLGNQIVRLISKVGGVHALSNIAQTFLHQFGYMLRPEQFECNSVFELMEKLKDLVKIVQTPIGPMVELVDKSHLQRLGLQCRRILMDQEYYRLPVGKFEEFYKQYYGSLCDKKVLRQDLPDVVQFSIVNLKQYIQLTAIQIFACNVLRVLTSSNGKINLQQFENAYRNIIGENCDPAHYGFITLTALLQALPCTVIIRESRNKKKMIYLNKKLAVVGISLPTGAISPAHHRDSSNDSRKSESPRVNISNTSVPDKWMDKIGQSTWNQKDETDLWQKKNSHWAALTSTEQSSEHWLALEGHNESFFRNLIQTPNRENKLRKPPKPDTPPDDDDQDESRWRSVWSTPPQIPQNIHGTNVDVPPLTLPTWNEIEGSDSASNLLSPTKNLLPAVANPLNPRTSPYFSNKHHVIAPHPSELPLPSLSLSFKSGKHSTETQCLCNDSGMDSRMFGNSLEVNSPTNSENFSISECDISDALNSTPSKKLFVGKRRLAAQFNQPINQ